MYNCIIVNAGKIVTGKYEFYFLYSFFCGPKFNFTIKPGGNSQMHMNLGLFIRVAKILLYNIDIDSCVQSMNFKLRGSGPNWTHTFSWVNPIVIHMTGTLINNSEQWYYIVSSFKESYLFGFTQRSKGILKKLEISTKTVVSWTFITIKYLLPMNFSSFIW